MSDVAAAAITGDMLHHVRVGGGKLIGLLYDSRSGPHFGRHLVERHHGQARGIALAGTGRQR